MPSTASSSASSVSVDFHDKKDMTSSVLVIVSLGLANVFIMKLPLFLAGIAATVLGIAGWVWFELHGGKLTRTQHVTFDEASLLQANEDANFKMVLVENRETGIFSKLFRNEKHAQMQAFYKKHYGPVWKTAKKAEIEQQKKRQEQLQQEKEEKELDEPVVDQEDLAKLIAELSAETAIGFDSSISPVSAIE